MRLHFNWKMSLFVVICLPITIAAGIWQLGRADEKRDMQSAHEALVNEAPVAALQLAPEQWRDYQNVTITGEFLPNSFLVDNQIYKGRFGYEVVTPFKLDDGRILMVSRGWILGSLDRRILPEFEAFTGKQTLTGYLYQPKPNPMTDDLPMSDGWPKVMQGSSVENMYNAQAINDKMRADFLVRLAPESTGILTPHWVVITMPPEKHLGYAFQWFAMATLLLVLFFWASIKRQDPASENSAENQSN